LAALLLSVGALWWRQHSPPPPPAHAALPVADKSIAVLPFENFSNDPANTYFAEGVKDEILTRLSKVGALKVISRTSTQKFKSAPDNIREIAQQLGVANILEGSVQRSGDVVRVTVQLVHAPTDTHVWAETYDRKLVDMFQVESEVAERVANSLAANLTGSETAALRAKPTANSEAHEEFLKGRYFWNKRSVDGYKLAVVHLRRAVELDGSYAQAYAGLADALLFLGGENVPEHEAILREGRATLHKALELDEAVADAHSSLGLLAMNFDWDWAAAEREFKRAIELNPNYATAHQWYGEFLADMGRSDEGIAEMKRAQALDPLSIIINSDVAKVYMISRRYDAAVEQFQRTLEMAPDFDQAHGLLALTYSLQGKHEQAIAEVRKIQGLDENSMALAWLGYVSAAAGDKEEAQRVLNRLNEPTGRSISPSWLTLVYSGMGDHEGAFGAFEKVLDEHASGGAVVLPANPLYESLRSDPRFAALLRRTNLAH
jgi:TolB-like protein/Tfp pilus assembly protein PilF